MFKSLGRRALAVPEAHAASTSLVWGDQERVPDWPAGPQSFAFDLDDDLTKVVNLKVVTVRVGPSALEVEVRYGGDMLLQEDRYSIPLERAPAISHDEFGVTVQVTRRILPWLSWPRWRLTYRF